MNAFFSSMKYLLGLYSDCLEWLFFEGEGDFAVSTLETTLVYQMFFRKTFFDIY